MGTAHQALLGDAVEGTTLGTSRTGGSVVPNSVDPDSRIPIVPSADNIHLFIMGGHAGRFSAFIPGWGHMSTPVLRAIDPAAALDHDGCADGVCAL